MKRLNVKFGIIAVRPPSTEILHFCGYKKEPEIETFTQLWKELSNDPEFGLVGKMKDVKLRKATSEQVEYFKRQIEP